MSDSHSSAPSEQPKLIADPNVNYFAMTNFRNQFRKFGIKLDDRRRHMYVVGKTGMGKSTLLENMVLNDIYAGHGIGLVDPHGDFAEKILNFIPANRINDVVYFNPADLDFPIGFNILETIRPEQKHLVASGLMGVFKKIWPDVWSARMEYILNNTILALLDFPGTTLLGINRMLSEEDYRKRVVNNTKDPVVKAFWQTEFASYTEKFRTEAVAPIQNKIGQFLSASVIRNIVAQVKSRIDIREIMDTQKIFIMNLSKGRIGEDNSRLLGGMLITRLQLGAMERVDVPEKDRKDFFLYVDEFQNFATESFANILSEARKYRLDLTMAHQYMEQLDETVLAAVIGNVGTMVTFRVGSTDAEILAKEFTPTFTEEDLVNLPKFQVYLKLMIDGVASRPFSATTLGPLSAPTGSTEKVIKVSRERYAVPRDKIEDKIMRWSGMLPSEGVDDAIMTEEEAEEADRLERAKPKPQPLPVVQSAPKPVTPIASKSISVQPVVARSPEPSRQLNREPQTHMQPQPARAPQQTQPTQQSSGTPHIQNGNPDGSQKKKRKRKRKKGNGGGMSLPNGTGESVLLVDPKEQGISLAQLTPPVESKPTVETKPAVERVPQPQTDLPTPLMLDDDSTTVQPVVHTPIVVPHPLPKISLHQAPAPVHQQPVQTVAPTSEPKPAPWLVNDAQIDIKPKSNPELSIPAKPDEPAPPIIPAPNPVEEIRPVATAPKTIQQGRVVKLDE